MRLLQDCCLTDPNRLRYLQRNWSGLDSGKVAFFRLAFSRDPFSWVLGRRACRITFPGRLDSALFFAGLMRCSLHLPGLSSIALSIQAGHTDESKTTPNSMELNHSWINKPKPQLSTNEIPRWTNIELSVDLQTPTGASIWTMKSCQTQQDASRLFLYAPAAAPLVADPWCAARAAPLQQLWSSRAAGFSRCWGAGKQAPLARLLRVWLQGGNGDKVDVELC